MGLGGGIKPHFVVQVYSILHRGFADFIDGQLYFLLMHVLLLAIQIFNM